MTTTYRLTLPLPPTDNHYKLPNGRGGQYLTKEARRFLKNVKDIGARCLPLLGDVTVKLLVYLPNRRTDVPNYIKVTLDSLEGITYVNDRQVRDLHAHGEDYRSKDPRIELVVRGDGKVTSKGGPRRLMVPSVYPPPGVKR